MNKKIIKMPVEIKRNICHREDGGHRDRIKRMFCSSLRDMCSLWQEIHFGYGLAALGFTIASLTAFLSVIFYYSRAESAEVSLKPSIVLREEYDDNIFLTHDDRKGDYITRILPSFHIDYKTPFWDLNSDYTLNWWYYANLREGKNSHNLNLISQVRIVKNLLYLDMSDIYSSVVLNPRRPSTEVNLDVNRSDSNNVIISPHVKYQINPLFSLSTGYRYTNIWYRRGDAVNRQTHTGFATVEYLYNRQLKTSFSAEYTYDRPENNPLDKPNNQTAAFFRAIYTLNPRTDIDASLGYRWILFSGGRKENMPVYSALIKYRFHETGRIELTASSIFTPSPELGTLESRTGQLTVVYGKPFVMNGGVYYRRDKYIERDQQDDTVGLSFGLEHKPNPRLTYKVSGRYEHGKFLPEKRKRDTYSASGDVSYALTNRASISLIYNHTRQNGRLEFDAYRDNIIAVQANITY
jgi:hypothetical protein